jgi:hypothetical protein
MKTILKTILTLVATGVALFSISLSALLQGCKSSGKAGNGNATPDPSTNQPPQPYRHSTNQPPQPYRHICDPVHQPHRPAEDRIGGILGRLSPLQKAQLQQDSPQTLAKIEHNDAASAGSPQPSAPPANPSQPTATPPAGTSHQMQPLTVDDIKALAAVGVKDDVITTEIQRSGSKFSKRAIAELQQAGVSSAVIDFIKTKTR